ncbi:hypothetical protein D9M68_712230 [compost metagenome]
MRGFERLAHHLGVAGAVEGVIGTADLVGPTLRHVDQIGHDVVAHFLRVDEVGHAEAFAPGLLVVVEVDADDHVGTGETQALDDVEADATKTEDDCGRAHLHLGRVDDRTDAGGDAAADVADLVEGRVRVDLGNGDLRQHRVVGEGRAAHVVVDLVLADREARGAVGHQALALGRADRGAEIGLARQAGRAGAAFGRVERNDVIALLH